MILALETGGELASVALLDGLELAAERVFRHRMSLSRDLLPVVDELMTQARVEREAVDAVAVGLGPGSYTGLRIGVVTAKALSWAWDRPVLGISSLAAMVAPCLAPPETLLCAVLEARAGEFFTALYQRRDGELQVRAEATVLRAEELAQRLGVYPGPVLMAGHTARFAGALSQTTGASRQTPVKSSGGERGNAPQGEAPTEQAVGSELATGDWRLASLLAFTDFNEEPQARWVGRLAAGRWRAGERDDPVALTPLYVRAPAPTVRPKKRTNE
jgi:tRNA threonylcarbamoyladenosine biosynthesis protein TsaB